MPGAFVWTIRQLKDDETLVLFTGALDERSNLGSFPRLEGVVTFDLAGVIRVTSGGVNRWIQLLSRLDGVTHLYYVRCSIPTVGQINMVRGFQGKGVVRSFYAPYICEETGEEENVLMTPEQITDINSPPRFTTEAGELVFGDLPRRYFAFLGAE